MIVVGVKATTRRSTRNVRSARFRFCPPAWAGRWKPRGVVGTAPDEMKQPYKAEGESIRKWPRGREITLSSAAVSILAKSNQSGYAYIVSFYIS